MLDRAPDAHALDTRQLAAFWAPLFTTWLMMSVEGPLLAALIARTPAPKAELAAWGVTMALAILAEAPIIMLLAATTALVKDRVSFERLHRFTLLLCAGLTVLLGLFVATPAFNLVATSAMGLEPAVVRASRQALTLLLPWPAAIGYRRFFQGVLILSGQTRRVALGTVARLGGITSVGFALFSFSSLPGAAAAAIAASTGVVLEALVVRVLAHGAARTLAAQPPSNTLSPPLPYRRIASFYGPLAATSLIGLAVQPMITLFLGHAARATESLAVLPVVNGLVFLFRSAGLSYQEVVIAKLGEHHGHAPALARFAWLLALLASGGLLLIAATPLADVWLQHVSGLDPELAALARVPLLVLSVIPASTVLISWQRAVVVQGGRTGALSTGMFFELVGVVVVLTLAIHVFDVVGATAAAIAIISGRVLANAYLVRPARQALAASSVNLSSLAR